MRCVTSQITAEDCQPFMAKPAEIVAYRVVIGPASLLTLADGGTPLEVTEGKWCSCRATTGIPRKRAGLEAVSVDEFDRLCTGRWCRSTGMIRTVAARNVRPAE
jgi:hypothetical protein